MIQQTNRRHERGAVSLFVVIFAALLLSVVTVSFVRVMNQEQRNATDNDLSQSAYDSALAGVEDAKRVVLACNQGRVSACTAIRSNACDTVARAGIASEATVGTNTETPIQTQSSGGSELDQAYTCVKIDTTSTDYLVDMQEAQTVMVPLRAVGTVTKVELNWFKEERDNITPANATAAMATLTPLASTGTLPKKANWPANGPALMEAQIIQPNASFTVADLDASDTTQTVYLFPSNAGTSGFGLINVRRDTPSTPRATDCDTVRYTNGGYLCSVVMDLAKPLPAGSELAFLRLSTIYRGSSVQVIMRDAGNQPVRFEGVQFTVDSTGRANDIFRRVESRLSTAVSEFPYPEGAVDIAGSLCKDFYVSTDAAGGAVCQP